MRIPLSLRVVALVIGVPAAVIYFSNYTRSPRRNHPAPSPAAVPSPVYDAAFWSIWGDGQAELAGYDLTYPQYGEARTGTAITIFVTETFSNRARVKADPGKHPRFDEFPVMKLNLVKDYQPGVYDYNEMSSVFVALAPVNGRSAGLPAKVSFSSQEWCGHVYGQALFDPRTVRTSVHSYFDGEGDAIKEIDYPADGISEDALPLWARGMAQPVLASGESRVVPLLVSLETARHAHVPLAWKRATLRREAAAGEDADVFSAEVDGGPRKSYFVERAGARRILRWESSTGEKAVLLDSARMKYWDMKGSASADALKRLGLSPRPPKTT
jgi:hypothetical protein